MKKIILLCITVGLLPFTAACHNYENVNITSENNDSSMTESVDDTMEAAFNEFGNVYITGVNTSALNDEERFVLYTQAKYCQAMTDADIETMREIVSSDVVFTHMSGRQQSREEYFADIKNGRLRYFTIGIESPVIELDGSKAIVEYTSVLNANAYGARGTYRMTGKHHYEKRNSSWILVNG